MATNKVEALRILAEERRKLVLSDISDSSPAAVKTIRELADAEDVPPAVRLAAAKDILDRDGFKPIERLAIAQVAPITGMRFELDQ